MLFAGGMALSMQFGIREPNQLTKFAAGEGPPFVVLSGLPVQDSIPDTPQGFGDDASVQFTDSLLLGAIGIAGLSPIAFQYENFGRLIRNVAPTALSIDSLSSHGAKNLLPWHTDNPYAFEGNCKVGSPSPRYLCFAGLRNADVNGGPVPTEILLVDDILEQANRKLIRQMKRAEFRFLPPESNDRLPFGPTPLLEADAGTKQPLFRVQAAPGQVVGLTDAAQNCVSELTEIIDSLEDRVVPIVVGAGSILMFDQYRVLHRRASFDPGSDLSQARWLRRCFACRNRRSGNLVDPIHRPFLWK